MDDDELLRRIRGARFYADVGQQVIADELGVSIDTYGKMENGKRAIKPLEKGAVIAAAAKHCGLPPAFFTAEWSVLEREQVDHELHEAQKELDVARGEIRRAKEQLRDLTELIEMATTLNVALNDRYAALKALADHVDPEGADGEDGERSPGELGDPPAAAAG